jgi:hypothetical protein
LMTMTTVMMITMMIMHLSWKTKRRTAKKKTTMTTMTGL